MNGSLLVVGGYGEVGKVAARSLARSFPGSVIVAGRRIESARAFARSTDGAVRALQLDINNLPAPEAYLEGVGSVVSSVERSDDRIVRHCLERGINYTEVAASFETLSEITPLGETYPRTRSSVITGVGLIPGLSGVLAGHLKQSADRMDEVGIHVLLGAGDEHGLDAIRWMQDYMDRTYTVRTGNGLQSVRSFTSPQKVIFPGERRKRTTYRFDFADQHVIPESVRATGASTFLCFDSRVMTRSIRLLRVSGLISLLRRIPPHTFARLLSSLPVGSDRYALLVTAHEEGTGRTVNAGVTGTREAHATGIVTASVASRLHEKLVPRGVHHLENVVALEDIVDELTREGIAVHATPVGHDECRYVHTLDS